VLLIVPESFSPTPAAAPVIALPCDSPFFTLTACVVILPLLHRRDRHEGLSRESLAGEEGFEPPYPVLETGVLTVGRLPFTPSPRSGRGVYPESIGPGGFPCHIFTSSNFFFRLQLLTSFSRFRAASLLP
jgi:hypothetical protein